MRTHYLVKDLRQACRERLGMVTNGQVLLGEVQFKVLWDDNKHEWVAAKYVKEDEDEQDEPTNG